MKALIIISPEDFRDEEYQVPKEVLEDAGVEVTTASTTEDECNGMFGTKVIPDALVSEADAGDYDAVIVAGGSGAEEHLWENEDVHTLANSAEAEGKIVAAICISPVVLANAGLLAGKKATVFETPATVDALQEGGAEYVKKDVVVDGRIITANGPEAAVEFAEKILDVMEA